MHTAADSLFHDPHAAAKLRMVDNYILQAHRFGSEFVMPREHRSLKPLVTRFFGNFNRFVFFVKEVRDASAPRSKQQAALHGLYRTLEVRLVQQERRDRVRRAVDWLEREHPRLTYDSRLRWARKLEQGWGRRRLSYMEDYRRMTAKHRLSTEEREEVLARFWTMIDNEINNGELPQP